MFPEGKYTWIHGFGSVPVLVLIHFLNSGQIFFREPELWENTKYKKPTCTSNFIHTTSSVEVNGIYLHDSNYLCAEVFVGLFFLLLGPILKLLLMLCRNLPPKKVL